MRTLIANRWLVFALITLVLVMINLATTQRLLPSADSDGLWFYSGIFLLAFSTFFVEPYFSSPQTTLANVVPLILVTLTSKQDFNEPAVWWVSLSLCLALLVAAVGAMSLPPTNSRSLPSRVSAVSLWISTHLGRSRVLLSAAFFVFLIGVENPLATNLPSLLALLATWAATVLVNPARLPKSLTLRPRKQRIASVSGFESARLFRGAVYPGATVPTPGTVVELETGEAATVIGRSRLHAANEFTALLTSKEVISGGRHSAHEVVATSVRVTRPPGLVDVGSSVETLLVRLSEDERVNVGDALMVQVANAPVCFQVVDVGVRSRHLSVDDSEGYLVAEANQVGTWEPSASGFIPSTTSAELDQVVELAQTATPGAPPPDLFLVGSMPGTRHPIFLNLRESIDHHLAIIGTTGSGKSQLADRMLKHLESTHKTICVDFTGEWAKRRPGTHAITQPSHFASFLASAATFALIELPSMSNTDATVKELANLMEALLDHAKTAFQGGTPIKVCLVLEEAHTIVPEQNFLGVNSFDAKAAVNKISQIALQGRKYGIGLMVLAQRTANVSKTVLTQCNTLLSFAVFDDTSKGFIANYVGAPLSEALSRLPKRHVVVVGKASPSVRPVVADATEPIVV